jgi:hypothetical protein
MPGAATGMQPLHMCCGAADHHYASANKHSQNNAPPPYPHAGSCNHLHLSRQLQPLKAGAHPGPSTTLPGRAWQHCRPTHVTQTSLLVTTPRGAARSGYLVKRSAPHLAPGERLPAAGPTLLTECGSLQHEPAVTRCTPAAAWGSAQVQAAARCFWYHLLCDCPPPSPHPLAAAGPGPANSHLPPGSPSLP